MFQTGILGMLRLDIILFCFFLKMVASDMTHWLWPEGLDAHFFPSFHPVSVICSVFCVQDNENAKQLTQKHDGMS